MKICLVTIKDNINIGTFLQIYASSHLLLGMGNEVEVVDYVRPRSKLLRRIVRELKTSKKILPTRLLLVPYILLEQKFASSILNGFLRKHVKLSPRRYRSFETLQRNPPTANVYITGSDQVWNSRYNEGVDRTFYLDFAPEGVARIAYASSFGLVELPDDQVAETSCLISKYSAISVREESALNILEKLGWTGAVQVLDPTLMLNREEWAKLANPRTCAERYLLIYCVEGERKAAAFENARIIARQQGLKIYQVSSGGLRSRIKGCDKIFYFTSPGDFLSLFLNAEFVVTSSFHGTAFSVNLNKPFISVMPPRYAGRASSLLKKLGLEDRMVVGTCELQNAIKPIDYVQINRQLDMAREESRSFLAAALGEK